MAAEVDAALAAKIKRQVEYYFSDVNLPKDKFLKAKTDEDADGYVDLSVITTFKRMQQIGASVEQIAEALRDSDIVSVSDDHLRVRRSVPLVELARFDDRSVFVGGLPKEPPPDIDDVRSVFERFGDVLSVKLRRDARSCFNGSAFVEFKSAEHALAAIAGAGSAAPEGDAGTAAPAVAPAKAPERGDDASTEHADATASSPPDVPPAEGSAPLASGAHESLPQDARAKTSAAPAAPTAGADAPSTEPPSAAQQGFVLGSPNTKLRVLSIADFKEMRRRGEVPEDRRGGGKAEAPPKKPVERGYGSGMVLRFESVGPGVSREDLKELFGPFGAIAWVDFSRDEADGYIRFASAESASKAKDDLEASAKQIGGKVPRLMVLQGDAERQFWERVWSQQDAKRKRVEEKKRQQRFGAQRRYKRRRRNDDRDGHAEEAKDADGAAEDDQTVGGSVPDAPPAEDVAPKGAATDGVAAAEREEKASAEAATTAPPSSTADDGE